MTLVLTDGNGGVVKFPYTKYNLREDNPNTSFPSEIGEDVLAAHNVYHVETLLPPDADPWTHEIVADTEPKLIGGKWTLGHYIREKTPQEINEWAQSAAVSRRAKRNAALSDSDWTQLPDNPLSDEQKAAWLTYREALRNLTAHPDWPRIEETDWPVKPE